MKLDQSRANSNPSEIIVSNVALTMLYTCVVGIATALMFPIPLPRYRWLLFFCWIGLLWRFYPPIHLHIDQAIVKKAIQLSQRIDSVYGLSEENKWGNWKSSSVFMFGTNWPITWLWLVFLAVAVTMGKSFRAVWKI